MLSPKRSIGYVEVEKGKQLEREHENNNLKEAEENEEDISDSHLLLKVNSFIEAEKELEQLRKKKKTYLIAICY